MISIVSGSLGIYDRAIKALEANERAVGYARSEIEKISDLAIEIAVYRTEYRSEDVRFIDGYTNSVMIRHLDNIQSIDPEILAQLGTGDLLIASEYALQNSRLELSISLAEFASARALDDLGRAYALKQQGRAYLSTKIPENEIVGRQAFEDAISIGRSSKAAGRDALISAVFADMVVFEASNNNCEKVVEAVDRYRQENFRAPARIVEDSVRRAIAESQKFFICDVR